MGPSNFSNPPTPSKGSIKTMTSVEADRFAAENPGVKLMSPEEAKRFMEEPRPDTEEGEKVTTIIVRHPATVQRRGVELPADIPWDVMADACADMLPSLDEPTWPPAGGYKGGRPKRPSTASDAAAAHKRVEKRRKQAKNAKKIRKAQRNKGK